jgi:hypothetical protein
MMADENRNISGGLALYGNKAQSPLVHMVCWDESEPCKVEVAGRVTLAGDKESPVRVTMAHFFENDHHQTHAIEPLDHALRVDSKLSEPIHHALQLRTPLDVRFCNSWNVASDYRVEVRWGERSVMSIRLTGATVATPQPCADEVPCAPVVSRPIPYS